jgi:hypothetical protein
LISPSAQQKITTKAIIQLIQNHLKLNMRLKGRQLELKYKDKFDDILSDTQKLTTELKQGLKQLALYQQQIDENRVGKIETELDAFLAGNGNIRFVIIEHDDNQSLLLGQVEASINYHKNRIKYDSLMDRLLIAE